MHVHRIVHFFIGQAIQCPWMMRSTPISGRSQIHDLAKQLGVTSDVIGRVMTNLEKFI